MSGWSRVEFVPSERLPAEEWSTVQTKIPTGGNVKTENAVGRAKCIVAVPLLILKQDKRRIKSRTI